MNSKPKWGSFENIDLIEDRFVLTVLCQHVYTSKNRHTLPIIYVKLLKFTVIYINIKLCTL